MNTTDISSIMKKLCANEFTGVFPSNHLPRYVKGECVLFVANTDSCDRGGEHWISIYIDEFGNGEYFDSFGFYPQKSFNDYMSKNCKRWTLNARRLQSFNSDYCGAFCVFYCAYRCKRFNLDNIVSLFTNDYAMNDRLVFNFARNR